jgi:hypothetical protein
MPPFLVASAAAPTRTRPVETSDLPHNTPDVKRAVRSSPSFSASGFETARISTHSVAATRRLARSRPGLGPAIHLASAFRSCATCARLMRLSSRWSAGTYDLGWPDARHQPAGSTTTHSRRGVGAGSRRSRCRPRAHRAGRMAARGGPGSPAVALARLPSSRSRGLLLASHYPLERHRYRTKLPAAGILEKVLHDASVHELERPGDRLLMSFNSGRPPDGTGMSVQRWPAGVVPPAPVLDLMKRRARSCRRARGSTSYHRPAADESRPRLGQDRHRSSPIPKWRINARHLGWRRADQRCDARG